MIYSPDASIVEASFTAQDTKTKSVEYKNHFVDYYDQVNKIPAKVLMNRTKQDFDAFFP